MQCGQLYQTANSKGLKWACVTGIAIAEATKPDATVDSVLGAIYDHCDKDLVVKRDRRTAFLYQGLQDNTGNEEQI